ncbi:Lipid-A-disaccharide synthase [Devosia equisanguinis]|uniref:Lipid-A-disaccharide synthase n=1 Tax=Devosia equisanguinis TaxID=2490941 RepID=A0A447IFR1_9HYPH|nr:lipid-A-disaccharide synthase [Devosia equisanguinis]VDS06315.1 Lipid-A-disaccharide synthase [Devosia equisanguinis]
MRESLRLFILAGEPSGDRIAADLVGRLRQKVDVALSGVGGDELIGQGLVPLFPMSDLAVMGVTDVILNLPKLLWRIGQAARAILRSQPDMVVLVDAQDFSRLLAARLRAKGYSGPIILYVAPSVWARHPERAAKLRPLFDATLAVLPFEPAVMQRLGGPPTRYVGHPALGEALLTETAPKQGPLVLLPGSRKGELRRHLPLLAAIAPSLLAEAAVTELVIPTLPALRGRLEKAVANWPVPVRIEDRRAERKALYGQAVAAICVSGTVTLELALARVPMLVIYALDGPQARVYEQIGRPQVSLPNIILGREAVPEMVSQSLSAEAVGGAAFALVRDQQVRQAQVAAFAELYTLMQAGEADYGRQDPADEVLAVLRGHVRR